MRGFLLAAMGLAALDMLLQAPTSNFAVAMATPTRWLAEWMDPRTPLIGAPASWSSSSSSSKSTAAPSGGFNPVHALENLLAPLLP